jgi:hypothetical protein
MKTTQLRFFILLIGTVVCSAQNSIGQDYNLLNSKIGEAKSKVPRYAIFLNELKRLSTNASKNKTNAKEARELYSRFKTTIDSVDNIFGIKNIRANIISKERVALSIIGSVPLPQTNRPTSTGSGGAVQRTALIETVTYQHPYQTSPSVGMYSPFSDYTNGVFSGGIGVTDCRNSPVSVSQTITVPSNPLIVKARITVTFRYFITGWLSNYGIAIGHYFIDIPNSFTPNFTLDDNSPNSLYTVSQVNGQPVNGLYLFSNPKAYNYTINSDILEVNGSNESTQSFEVYTVPNTTKTIKFGVRPIDTNSPNACAYRTSGDFSGGYLYSEFEVKSITVDYFKAQ